MNMVAGGSDVDTGSTSVVVMGPTMDVVTIRVTGEVTPEIAMLAAQAFDNVVGGHTVVVGMAGVSFLSLEGASMLAVLVLRCGEEGRILRVEPSAAVRTKLIQTGLDAVVLLDE